MSARSKTVTLAHGGGGTASAELTRDIFLPAFRNPLLESLSDGAVFAPPSSGRIAFSTDTFVIDPIFFPGGNIGSLAVHGTVNDLAVSGATPKYLSAGFVLEEGLPLSELKEIARAMGEAARDCGVAIVTGDTKVVPKGGADKIFINTTGVGWVSHGIDISQQRIKDGDAVIVSGTIGDHGISILTLRKGLEFDTDVMSDSQPLNGLVAAMLAADPTIRMMRDPTRGGLAASLCEIASVAGKGIEIRETDIPVASGVRALCEILGLDVLHVANEGKLVAFVAPENAAKVLDAMRAHPAGRDSAIIGTVGGTPGRVEMKTGFVGNRIIEPLVGDQLPRIC